VLSPQPNHRYSTVLRAILDVEGRMLRIPLKMTADSGRT